MTRCLGKQRPKLKPKEKPRCLVDCMEEERRARYERLKDCAPAGFAEVLEKIIRNVVLARPIHICLFIADFLDAEISRRTFNDIVYGCQLKKSRQALGEPYPTESCMLIKNWFLSLDKKRGVDDKQFLRGAIPEYELEEPALDRYRDYAGIEAFDMSQYELDEDKKQEEMEKKPEEEDLSMVFPEVPCVQERVESAPAYDRYREYAGIGPFDPDDVDDACYDYQRIGFHVPNCTCTFCTIKAEKSKKPKVEGDPCVAQRPTQTLYIEQPVYREPAYDKVCLNRKLTATKTRHSSSTET